MIAERAAGTTETRRMALQPGGTTRCFSHRPGAGATGGCQTTARSARRAVSERLLPLFLPLAGIAAVFVSLAWLGIYRRLPDILRLRARFHPHLRLRGEPAALARLRWPAAEEADRLLEERNQLPHQPVAVQDDEPAFDTPFARALWPSTSGAWPRRLPPSMPGCRGRTCPLRPLCAAHHRLFSSSRPSPIPARTAPASLLTPFAVAGRQ